MTTRVGTKPSSWTVVEAEDVGLGGTAWNREVLAAETGTLFHTREWTEAMARGFHRHPRYFAFLDGSGTTRCLFPVVEGRAGPLRTSYSPITILTPYAGPACPLADLTRALDTIVTLRRAERWDYLRISFLPSASKLPASDRYTILPGATQIVSLESDEAMWKSLHAGCRRAIQKAQKEGVEVRDLASFASLDQYMSWGREAHAKRGDVYPIPEALLRALEQHVLPSGRLLIRAAFVDGRAVTYWLFGLGERTLYYLDSSMNRAANVVGAGNRVVWETMRLAARRGLTDFDMVGTNIAGIAQFKRSFGGTEVPANGLEISNRRMRLARGLLSLSRRTS